METRQPALVEFTSHLTAAGQKVHGNQIDVSKLKVSHVEAAREIQTVNWHTLCMIVPTDSQKYRSIVFDTQVGMYKTQKSPDQIMNTFKNTHPLLCNFLHKEIANYCGISEYIPLVSGETAIIPLKTSKHCHQRAWVSSLMIKNLTGGKRPGTTDIWFTEKNVNPVLLEATAGFIKSRQNDATTISTFHKSINNLLTLVLKNYDQPNFDVNQICDNGIFNFKDFSYSFKESIVNILANHWGFELTPQDEKEAIKKITD
ncbi:hypothetical protein [Lentilactobacillus sp. Marseille-Q4993]|uniref:hypothetical protein n=1 Tax=Lentilactobacillus sp. Marseille-Q4993 TaxID=3039492 RepID=UPI0024BCA625|nr:hypothetical protein [Lentilactobacillus sp. Marseille-Q4993]